MKKEAVKATNVEVKKFKLTKAIDLINRVIEEPEPKYLWKGIPEGSTGLITGVSKTGKTTFAENLAISLCVGRSEFFGYKMDGVPRKVLYINLEESFRVRSRRNLNQIKKLNKNELELFEQNYFSTPEEFPEFLNTIQNWSNLRDFIIDSEAEVVFIDSLSHMCIGEIERSSVAQQFAQTFRKYVRSLNKTIIVVHHNTKGNDKPIDQDSIAGSRFILQEFEFAYGFANIPTSRGGNYSCMLFNKYIEKDDTTSYLYKVTSNAWIELLGIENKFNLYKPSKNKDGRVDTTNPDLIYKYIENQGNQGNQIISTKELKEVFVEDKSSTMSTDTLHKSLNKLITVDKISKIKNGIYELKNKKEDGTKAV